MAPGTIESITYTAHDLTQYLKENGQTELALQYSLDALYSAIQHVNVQNMGIAMEKSKVICFWQLLQQPILQQLSCQVSFSQTLF